MKRFHVHLHVDDLARSIDFYSKLFAAAPTRVEADYAKWMLDDPAVNFAISTRGSQPGLDHLGFQTDDPAELDAMKARAQAADLARWTKAPPPAATPRATSTGSPTRKALLGNTSTPWATSPCSVRATPRQALRPAAPPAPQHPWPLPLRPQPLVGAARRVASRLASR